VTWEEQLDSDVHPEEDTVASSLFNKISQLASSPQAQRVVNQAKDFASKPETKAKIEQARQRLQKKR